MGVSVKRVTSWNRVLNSARKTAGKLPLNTEPSDKFKRAMIKAEHSVIRLLEYDIDIDSVPMWVTTHLVRHHVGTEKFVRTQRSDRNEDVKDRDNLPQAALNDMTMVCNAHAIINISKVRLCKLASKETRQVWEDVIGELRHIDPILASACVPSCVYRGFCPEHTPCGYSQTSAFVEAREEYVNNLRDK